MIEVPVTAYVRQYLLREYGPGPYRIDLDAKNKLRLSFMAAHIHGVIFSSVYTHAAVQLSIAKSPMLVRYYEQHKAFFDRGVFGASEFFQAFYQQVETQCRVAREAAISQVEMNYRIAIEQFMLRYGIEEEMYSFDNLYRQFSRHKRARRFYQGDREIPVISPGSMRIRIRPPKFFAA